jgi:phosphoribosylformylglycinamidine cyclo-ligase
VRPLTYAGAGVDYEALDAVKRACQEAARSTVGALAGRDLREPPGVRGESAYLLETDDGYLAHVEEGLGTKNLIADAMFDATGESFYRHVGIDTVATIVNDLVTCGAEPAIVAMHAAVGDVAWFARGTCAADLAQGFAAACLDAGAVWGGGETPALTDMVAANTIVLAGSAVGRIRPKAARIAGNVADGDAIVTLTSAGVHTNGLTLCRALAQRLPDGYLTRLPDGRRYGEALLDPSVIYARFVRACREAAVPLHYAVHLTGHGWRKLMRLDEPFVYRVATLPPPPPIFPFLQAAASLDDREAYGTFNMGAGFVVYVPAPDAERCVTVATEAGYQAAVAGSVRREGGRKAVELEPLGLRFEADSLQVR